MPSTRAWVSRSSTGSVAPGERVAAGRRARPLAGVRVGDRQQPLRGVGPAVEHDVLDELAQLGLDVVVDRAARRR